MNGWLARTGAGWLRIRMAMPAFCAILLVVAGLFLAWESERRSVAQRVAQTAVQARIMAATVAGALAFDDADAAREYLDALKLNPNIQAAAVYARGGRQMAGFSKDAAPLPASAGPHPPVVDDLTIVMVEPVRQGRLDLGTVYVKARIEPVAVRLSRYLAVGAVIAFAAMLIFMLGRSFVRVAEANVRLREEMAAREQAESALVQAQKMEALGQLTGGIAHDFNNLLMAAGSGLELLERTTDPERRERLRQGIREVLDRGARVTRQLLTFARRSPVNAEPVDLAHRLRGIEDLLERSLRENVRVVYALSDDLWPVFVDPTQFEVAVVNIAVNARDAMPQGGAITISARNAPTGLRGADAVRITVTDEGCGMTPDVVGRVFDPFFTTKPVGQGTGLGLSQVYGFVEGCGGHIEVDSAMGRGTAITLLLPRGPASEAHANCEADGRAVAAVRPRRVLVVEDDPRIAEALCEMLRELGCSAKGAGDGEAALELISDGAVDIVLSDMVMPGKVTGLDLARILRQREQPVPVVLMSGYSEAAQRAKEEGFRLLDKPFGIEALAAALG